MTRPSVPFLFLVTLFASVVSAQDNTPGYPEMVIQWTVEKGERCTDVARTLYESAEHVSLVERYNSVDCSAALEAGRILVLPSAVTNLPPARLNSSVPTVRARAADGDWETATDGMPLFRGHGVNTLEKANADILFRDRSRIVLGEQTLVVIYGTAENSKRRKMEAASLELEEGELRAGIAALSGKSWKMKTPGGASVQARSEDVVIRRSQETTTVSVFDGEAEVQSAGSRVQVPAAHGTRFKKATPPEPPRPLPPAPGWSGSSLPPVQLVGKAGGEIRVSWKAMEEAARYRVEMSLDAAFTRVAIRQEVPKTVHAFRAEKLPPGVYYLRVHAVDKHDLLGFPAPTRSVHLVAAKGAGMGLTAESLQLSAYGRVDLTGPSTVKVELDSSSRRLALPTRVDLLHHQARSLTLHLADGSRRRYVIEGLVAKPQVLARWEDAEHVALSGVVPGGSQEHQRAELTVELLQEGSPLRRVALPKGKEEWALKVAVSPGGPVSGTVKDQRGQALSTFTLPVPAPPPRARRAPELGARMPLVSGDPVASTDWWSPVAKNTAMASLAWNTEAERFRGMGRVEGSVGAFSVGARGAMDLEAEQDKGDDAVALYAGWGAKLPAARRLGLRLGVLLPVAGKSAAPRIEGDFAFGGRAQRWGYLANLGARVDTGSGDQFSTFHPSVRVGSSLDLDALRLFAMAEGHWLSREEHLRAAAQAGLEFGQPWFGTLAVRMSPWSDFGGHAAVMVGFGIRGD